jgi:general secretion pathway protein I
MTRATAGFTLLEVMMAMAILAVCLSAVFSTEAGAIHMSTRARKTSVAALLVRCKMGEIEEKIAKEGLPAVFAQGQDNCCTDAPIEGFGCRWDINPIIMPDTMFGDPSKNPLAKGTALGGQTPSSAAGAAQLPMGSAPGSTAMPGALGATAPGALPGQTKPSPTDMLASDPSQMLQPGGAGGAIDGLAAMALQFVYPVLKTSFEGQIRRATVTVTWKEGSRDHSFDVTQYIVAEQPAVIDPTTLPAGQNGQPGQTGQPGAPGTGTGTQPTAPGVGLGGGLPQPFGMPSGLPGGP